MIYLRFLAMLMVAGLFSGCSNTGSYPASPNFDVETGTFQHPKGYRHDKGFFDVLGLAGRFLMRDEDPAETDGFPLLDPTKVAMNDGLSRVTWIGHSTLLFSHGGINVLTDPVFSKRASPFQFLGPKRVVPAAYEPHELPDVDIIVISHAHYDHLDIPGLETLARLQPEIRVVVPLGLAEMVRDAGFSDVREIDWWQEDERDGVAVTATPLRHWASRSPFDRNRTLWAGFMIRFPDGFRFYFAGDTGYGEDFVETRERLGAPDFAAIPIGAYEPQDFMRESHCTPEEAVQIFRDLQATRAVAVHWGTFKLTLEPLAEPPERLRAALSEAGIDMRRFRALSHGEVWNFQDSGSNAG